MVMVESYISLKKNLANLPTPNSSTKSSKATTTTVVIAVAVATTEANPEAVETEVTFPEATTPKG